MDEYIKKITKHIHFLLTHILSEAVKHNIKWSYGLNMNLYVMMCVSSYNFLQK